MQVKVYKCTSNVGFCPQMGWCPCKDECYCTSSAEFTYNWVTKCLQITGRPLSPGTSGEISSKSSLRYIQPQRQRCAIISTFFVISVTNTPQPHHKAAFAVREQNLTINTLSLTVTCSEIFSITVLTYFHCRTQIRIRTRTQIPVLCRYYGKRIWIWIWVSGNMFCITLCSHRVWNPSLTPNLNLSPAVEISHFSVHLYISNHILRESLCARHQHVPYVTRFYPTSRWSLVHTYRHC